MRHEVERLNLTGGATIVAPRSLISRLMQVGVLDDESARAAIRLYELQHRAARCNEVPAVDAATQVVETVDELIRRIASGADRVLVVGVSDGEPSHAGAASPGEG